MILIKNNIGLRRRRQSLFDVVSSQIGRAFQRGESNSSLSVPSHVNSPSSTAKHDDVFQPFIASENEDPIVSTSVNPSPLRCSEHTIKISSHTEPHIYGRQSSQTPQERTWRVGSICFGGELITKT